MPSPFPGMDPYLEAPDIFPDFHHEMISGIRERLNTNLRPAYHSMVEERVYISDETDPGRKAIIPDVTVVQPALATRGAATNGTRGGITGALEADLAVAEPVVATTMVDEEIREARVVIYDAAGRQVVTVIEVLSPTNKIVGSRGRANYEAKRLDVLQSPAHLVEIDLLRDGVSIYPGEQIPDHDYLVHVSKRGDRPRGILWPILITQRLPVIAIPLLPRDPDFGLDLADIFRTAYQRGGYDMMFDYTQSPKVPLDSRAAKWAETWLAGRSGTPNQT